MEDIKDIDYFGLPAKIENLEDLNDGLSRIKVYVANPGINQKDIDIPKEVFEDAFKSALGMPIVAHFFKDGNLGGHESDMVKIGFDRRKTGKTYMYGFVDYQEMPKWETIDGVEWVTMIGYIATERFPEAVAILKSNQSMEVKLDFEDARAKIKKVRKMKFMSLCSLNTKGISPTFLGSKFVQFSQGEDGHYLENDIAEYYRRLKELFADDELEALIKMKKEDVDKIQNKISVSTDPDKVIDGNVGEKDIVEMEKKVLDASNRAEVIPKIFARYPGDVTAAINRADVGYPLMSEREGVFYYNTGFIKAASSRIEQQKDQPYYKEVRDRISKVREKVGMIKNFNNEREVFVLNGEMMKKAMMGMMEKYGMRYMPYAMDEKYVYAMDMDKDMAKMMMPYAMMEDDKMAMEYDKMMAMDYEEKEMGIKTAMGILHQKMMEMKEEKDGMMAKYSTVEEELSTIKEEFSTFKDDAAKSKVDDDGSSAAKDGEIKTYSVEEYTILNDKVIELEKDLQTKSDELDVFAMEKKVLEFDAILSKVEFSGLTDENRASLKENIDLTIEAFEEKVKSTMFTIVMEAVKEGKEENFFSMGIPKTGDVIIEKVQSESKSNLEAAKEYIEK